jgi:hypothetical protein
VDRLALVELIEGQAARLTPEGRDLAQRMEFLAEVPPGARSQRARDATCPNGRSVGPAATRPEHPRAAADAVGGA